MEISYAILVNFLPAFFGVELPPTASAQLLFDPQCNTLVIHYAKTPRFRVILTSEMALNDPQNPLLNGFREEITREMS